MAYITQYEYYENNGNQPEDKNWGSYQYVSLYDIVNNFMLMYSGNHSLVNNEERYKVLFHAKRGIQELNYDAFKEIKILQLTVCNTLRFVLPSDYVNWVRISVYKNGLLYPLTEFFQELLFIKIFKGTKSNLKRFTNLANSINKKLPNYASKYSSKEIVAALKRLSYIDSKIKESKLNDESAITEFLFSTIKNG